MRATHIDIVVGGQYGSEGKGAVAAAMAKRYDYDTLIRVAGPNAGHTVVDLMGQKRALRQIPAAGIVDHDSNLYIAPGSEIDPQVLADDIEVYKAAGVPTEGRLFVSPQATIVTEMHRRMEADPKFGFAGSTRKGIGAARAERMMRKVTLVQDWHWPSLQSLGAIVGDPPDSITAMIEGCQGYWLGSHAGLYPFCTSSDCRAVDFLAMSGITRFDHAQAWVVFRSFPIRIAGNSGPLSRPTTWDQIGVEPEYTTVTKKVRRVGHWEPDRVAQAIEANYLGPDRPVIAFTFADYLSADPWEQRRRAASLLGRDVDELRYIGNGPDSGIWV